MTTKAIKEFGLHLEIVIDDHGQHWFVDDHISGNKTPIYATPLGWKNEAIIAHVKKMLGIAKAEVKEAK